MPGSLTPKSGHKRFVHSCGDPGLFLSGDLRDRSRDVWLLLERGEVVPPWAILLYGPFDILHQSAEAFPCVISCTFILPIAERSLARVGTWTVGRSPEHLKAGVTGQPLGDGLGLRNTIIIDDAIAAGHA